MTRRRGGRRAALAAVGLGALIATGWAPPAAAQDGYGGDCLTWPTGVELDRADTESASAELSFEDVPYPQPPEDPNSLITGTVDWGDGTVDPINHNSGGSDSTGPSYFHAYARRTLPSGRATVVVEASGETAWYEPGQPGRSRSEPCGTSGTFEVTLPWEGAAATTTTEEPAALPASVADLVVPILGQQLVAPDEVPDDMELACTSEDGFNIFVSPTTGVAARVDAAINAEFPAGASYLDPDTCVLYSATGAVLATYEPASDAGRSLSWLLWPLAAVTMVVVGTVFYARSRWRRMNDLGSSISTGPGGA